MGWRDWCILIVDKNLFYCAQIFRLGSDIIFNTHTTSDCLFVLWFNVPVNNYGHVETVG